MANIQVRPARNGTTRYRVQVRRKGAPPQTATFKKYADAKRWAAGIEAAIRDGHSFLSSNARRRKFAEMIALEARLAEIESKSIRRVA